MSALIPILLFLGALLLAVGLRGPTLACAGAALLAVAYGFSLFGAA